MKTPYEIEIDFISHKMKSENFNEDFIKDCVDLSKEYEGLFELLLLWVNETDIKEKILTQLDILKTINEITLKR